MCRHSLARTAADSERLVIYIVRYRSESAAAWAGQMETLDKLRAQKKEIEDAKARDHRKNQLLEEAESIRNQIRSWGIVPVA